MPQRQLQRSHILEYVKNSKGEVIAKQATL